MAALQWRYLLMSDSILVFFILMYILAFFRMTVFTFLSIHGFLSFSSPAWLWVFIRPLSHVFNLCHSVQLHSQNAEKATHIKGRLLDQAIIFFYCVPFQMGTSIKGKNLLPEGPNSFLYEQFLIEWKITFNTLSDLP